MKLKFITLSLLSLFYVATTTAQTPLWQGKGRIAISSDGNEHDHDDWAATPLTLSLIAAKGLQDKMVLYTYSDHVWGSNQEMPLVEGMTAYEHMRESALGGAKHFGFDPARFICAVDNAEVAYNAMASKINQSTECDPLIIIAAGPMQVVGEAINRSNIECRKYVTVVSHSSWNNKHSDNPYMKTDWDRHSGWTFDGMREAFESEDGGEVTFVQIADQNGGEGYVGLNAPMELFDWIKTSPARNNPIYEEGSWDWLYSRIATCIKRKKNYDPSDAGMVIYLFTGEQKTSPDMAREIMENPVAASKAIETPAEAIEALKEGNRRFVEGENNHGHSDMGYVKSLDVNGQKPFATVIACSDSRVPVELLFDQGFGDLFVIRTAGNSLIDNVTLGSVDYAINHLKSKVVVVLGHTNCGAITSIVNMGDEHAHAVDNDAEVEELLESIAAYIPQHKGSHKELDQAILDNVEVQKEQVVSREHIKKLISDKQLDVVSAIYHLDSGVVEFL